MATRKLEVKIIGDASSLTRALGQSGAATSAWGKKVTGVHAQVSKSFGGLAASAAKFAAVSVGITGVAAGLAKAGQAVVGFDKAMRNVNSIAQLSEGRLKSLQGQVLKLAGKTAQAPQTLAEGLYDLVSSGFNAQDSMKVLAASAKAATAGLTTTEISTKAVAAVLNAYHRPAKDAANVSDVLFQTVNRGVISFETLAQTIGDVLPFASSLGVNVNQVGAALSTMTKEGLSGEEATTRLKNTLVAFIKPTDAMSAAIKKAGASSGEALVKQKGFQGALEAVIGSTDGTKESLAKLFPNIRALGGALSLTGKNARSAHGDLAAFRDVTGATNKALSQQSKSIAYQWNKIKATFSAIAIAAGSVVVPAFGNALSAVVKFASKARDKFGDLLHDFRALKSTRGSASAALGAMLSDAVHSIDWQKIGRTISDGFSAAVHFGDKLSAAVTSGINAAFSHVDVKKLGATLAGVMVEAMGTILDPSFWVHHIGAALSLVSIIIPVGKILKVPGFGFLYEKISRPLFSIVGRISTGLLRLFGRMGSTAVTEFIAELSNVAPRTANVLLSVVGISSRTFSKLPGRLKGYAVRAGSAVVGALDSAVGAIAGEYGRWVGAGVSALGKGVSRIGAAVQKMGMGAVTALRQFVGAFYRIGLDMLTGLAHGIAAKAKDIYDTAKSVVSGAVNGVKGFLGIRSPSKLFAEIGKNIALGLGQGIRNNANAVRQAMKVGLLYPIDDAIAKLNAQRDKLQSSFDAWDRRRERQSLVAQLQAARAGGSSGGGGGVSLSGSGSSDAVSATAAVHAKGLSSEQRKILGMIVGIGRKRGATSKQLLAAVETGLVESGLRNLSYGDGTSVGWRQETASSYGSVARRMNLTGSINRFFSEVMGLGSKSRGMTAGQIAQAVQRSAFPGRYDQMRGRALALLGSAGGSPGGGGSSSGASRRIKSLEDEIDKLRKEKRNLPSGKAGTARRKSLSNEIADKLSEVRNLKASARGTSEIADAIKALKDFDRETQRAKKLAAIDLKIKGLDQLKAFKDAVAGIRGQIHDLAGQAAQAWRSLREGQISKTHDAAIAAINGSADAQELASLQQQDADEQDRKTKAQLDKDLADAIASGDKQAQQDAQDAIADYARQKREAELQANLDAAKQKADDDEQTAMDALDQQTADYQANLEAQLGVLTANLEQRKVTYAKFAQDVNKILASYGLSLDTSPEDEQAVNSGPGAAYTAYNPWAAARKRMTQRARGHAAGGIIGRVGEVGPEDLRTDAAGRVLVTPASQSYGYPGGVYIDMRGAKVGSRRDAEIMGNKLAYRAKFG